MKAEPFQSRNVACRKNKGDIVPLDVDHKRLQTKYNTIKKQWRQISDSKKNGSRLAGRDDPQWFIIVNPVLSDTNGGINAVCSGPLDTSLVDTNMNEFNSENEVGEDTEYNDASSDEQESESEYFRENIRKRKNAVDTCADKVVEAAKNKKKVVAKPHEKRSVARSQLQAMSHLTASVNRLAEVNAR